MIKRYKDFEIIVSQKDKELYANLGVAPGDRHLAKDIPISLPNDDRKSWIEAQQGRKDEGELAELGHRLYKAFITGELADKWNTCLGEIGKSETGLRLRFSYEAEVLTEVPLELICKRTTPTCEFLGLEPETPIIRSPRHGNQHRDERPGTLPLKMLVVIANTKLKGNINPAEEKTRIEEALAELLSSKKLIIEYLGIENQPRADFDTLHRTLTDRAYDIMHFIGHGALPDPDDKNSEGILLFLESETKRSQNVRGSDMAGIIALNGVRIVILQACEGARAGTQNVFQGVAQQLIAKGLPAVVAMQRPVDKDVASFFCSQLYKFWLKSGLPLERAVTEGRIAVRQKFSDRPSAWWSPVLFIRHESTEVLKVEMQHDFLVSVSLISPDQKKEGVTDSRDYVLYINIYDEEEDIPYEQNRDNLLNISCVSLSDSPWQAIFDSDEVLSRFEEALKVVEEQEGSYLLILLNIKSERIQNWEWEKLTLPGEDEPISIRNRVEFARLSSAKESQLVTTKVSMRPSVIGVIASDKKMEKTFNDLCQSYNLAHYLMTQERITLKRITDRLETGRFNILHLQVYGILYLEIEKELPRLGIILEPRTQKVDPIIVTISDIKSAFGKLNGKLPHIVIADIAHSDRKNDYQLINRFASALIQIGIPAVITICDRMTPDLAKRFYNAFYQELSDESGRVGAALTKARHALYESFRDGMTTNQIASHILPVFHLCENDNIQFQSGLFERFDIYISEDNTLSLRVRSQSIEDYDVENYQEKQITIPEFLELSEALLDRVNKFPSSPRNFMILHSKPKYGRTITLKKLLHRQLQFLEARMLDMIPVPLNISEMSHELFSSENEWNKTIKQKLCNFYDIAMSDASFNFSLGELRCLLLIDNVHYLPADLIQVLHNFINKQLRHFFVLACPTYSLDKLRMFGTKKNIRLCGFQSLDLLSKNNILRRYIKENEQIKEMTYSPQIYFEFKNIIESYSNYDKCPDSLSDFIEEWLKSRLRKRESKVELECIISAMEILAYHSLYDVQNTSMSQGRMKEYLAGLIEDCQIDSVLSDLIKQYHLSPEINDPDLYVFTYPVVQSFLTARYLSNKIESGETPSLFEICRSEDKSKHATLEFLVEMLQKDGRRAIIIHEQIIFDAIRADKPFLAGRLVNKIRLSSKAGYGLSPRIMRLVFISLLEKFANGNESDQQNFIDWLNVEEIIESLEQNFTIKCNDRGIEKIKELLSGERKDARMAFRILPWITSYQSVPLVLEVPAERQNLYPQFFNLTHKQWLNNNLISWLKASGKESVYIIRLKEMRERGEIDRDVIKIIEEIFA